jgi:hypothetical protein
VPFLLSVPGTFVFLDGGVLDLGVVRDQTLVGTNDAVIFSETFENVARRGNDDAAMLIDCEVCPDGSTTAAVTLDPCVIGS